MSFAANRLIVAADGSVVFPGIDYSGAKLTLHWRGGPEGERPPDGPLRPTLLVVKIGGTSARSARFSEPEYVRARFAVYSVTGKLTKNVRYMNVVGTEYPIEQVVEFPIKRGDL